MRDEFDEARKVKKVRKNMDEGERRNDLAPSLASPLNLGSYAFKKDDLAKVLHKTPGLTTPSARKKQEWIYTAYLSHVMGQELQYREVIKR